MKETLSVRLSAEKVYKRRIIFKIASLATLALLLLTTTVYSFVYLVNQTGNFTISLDDATRGNIIMSPTSDFDKKTSFLSAKALDYMDNISEKWLPSDIHEQEGEHSADNYIAYSFFLKNVGDKIIDYNATIAILAVIKNVDEAVRVAVYHEKEKTVYAKVNRETKEPEPNTTPFYSNTKVMDRIIQGFKPEEVHKFTIVIWLEGDDPDCVDDILGGEMKMAKIIRQIKEY